MHPIFTAGGTQGAELGRKLFQHAREREAVPPEPGHVAPEPEHDAEGRAGSSRPARPAMGIDPAALDTRPRPSQQHRQALDRGNVNKLELSFCMQLKSVELSHTQLTLMVDCSSMTMANGHPFSAILHGLHPQSGIISPCRAGLRAYMLMWLILFLSTDRGGAD